jgi:hypothetical protein
MSVVTRSMTKASNKSVISAISAISKKPEINLVKTILPRRKCTYNINNLISDIKKMNI